jgi:hypothetical protein
LDGRVSNGLPWEHNGNFAAAVNRFGRAGSQPLAVPEATGGAFRGKQACLGVSSDLSTVEFCAHRDAIDKPRANSGNLNPRFEEFQAAPLCSHPLQFALKRA